MLADQLEHRAGAGSDDLVFPNKAGNPILASSFNSNFWTPAKQRAGLVGVRFHDLRHTAVALAIQHGAHPKAIQERLGHSSIVVTLDRYGHLYEGLDTDLADALDAALRTSRGQAAAWGPSEGVPGTSENGVSAGQTGWALRGSNPRPPPCKGGALAS